MKTIDRRDFLKIMGMVGLSAVTPWPLRQARAQSLTPYDGPLFVSVAASGGWDPTSFCDPKENVPGEREINHWSRTLETGTIPGSAITYAPFANNQEFFERFHPDMLVLNGIDSQTNSHDVGVRHNWSGRIQPGFPAFAAIAAAIFGEDMPLPFLTNGGYRETAGLVTYTEVSGVRDLQELIDVNRVPRRDRFYHAADELAVIEAYEQARLDDEILRGDLLPRQRRPLENLAVARANRDQLLALTVSLPTQLVSSTDKNGLNNPLLQQAQMALVSFQAGLTVAVDLQVGGFDTHGNHDNDHRTSLQRLTNGITYLWDTAEEMGLADRLVVMVASDFGRTPSYNNGNGKDHWPITSAIFMKKNVAWTNRVVGASDEGHDALRIDPNTLAVTTGSNGVTPTPADVHETLRRIAGVDTHPIVRSFRLESQRIDVLGTAV